MTPMRTRTFVLGGLAALLLSALSVAGLALVQNGSQHGSWSWGPDHMGRDPRPGCTTSRLPGSHVTVVMGDMGSRGRGPMMSGPMMGDAMMGGLMMSGHRMMLVASTRSVPAGQVSLVAVNRGSRTHELLVLPLGAHATVGSRPVRTDRTVDESASLGEASRTCGAGEGDGIRAGGVGWVTLNLASGRYELLCNRPGHYRAGMYAELDVR